jgi:hypothetical protein
MYSLLSPFSAECSQGLTERLIIISHQRTPRQHHRQATGGAAAGEAFYYRIIGIGELYIYTAFVQLARVFL